MPVTRDLILLFIAYHPSRKEVANLESCLAKLPTNIGYAVVVNDYAPGEPVDSLAPNSDKFITFQENIGYGREANCLFAQLDTSPPYIAVLNTDIFWNSGTFEHILLWINSNLNVGLLVPKILNERGEPQYLCKKILPCWHFLVVAFGTLVLSHLGFRDMINGLSCLPAIMIVCWTLLI